MRRVLAFLLALLSAPVPAQPTGVDGVLCPDAEIWGAKLMSGICWSCLFPLRLFGADIGDGNVPAGAAQLPACACTNELGIPEIGIPLGAWMPARLIEIVRKPYCSPTLGGTAIRDTMTGFGTRGGIGGLGDKGFYQYHYLSFPLAEILEFISSAECHPGGYTNLDIMYLSELDPTWNEDELALLTNPEAVIFSNPALQLACPADCVAATAGSPVDTMYWCAGCWGGMYPFTGNLSNNTSPVRSSSLLASRAIAALHRRGLAWGTVGETNMCHGGTIAPMIPKGQYKMSMLFPIAEADGSGPCVPDNSGGSCASGGGSAPGSIGIGDGVIGRCCHNIGASTMFWGEWRHLPAVGEDFLYLLWRWTDCCVR